MQAGPPRQRRRAGAAEKSTSAIRIELRANPAYIPYPATGYIFPFCSRRAIQFPWPVMRALSFLALRMHFEMHSTLVLVDVQWRQELQNRLPQPAVCRMIGIALVPNHADKRRIDRHWRNID